MLKPALGDWPEPAVRSGTTLPKLHKLAFIIKGGGIYVPEVGNFSSGNTGALEGVLTWNYKLFSELGLFGKHTVARMWWDDVSMLTLGNEAGVRFHPLPFLVFEAAYLGHRAETEWLDSDDGTKTKLALGGIRDHGGEIGIWGRWDPLARLRVEPHLLGRAFQVYKTSQLILGMGLRLSFLVVDGHSAVIEAETLAVYRPEPRTGVEQTTWNTIGKLKWHSTLTAWLGIQVGIHASTNWFSGEIPMMELKRSMIDKPMAMVILGFYFFI